MSHDGCAADKNSQASFDVLQVPSPTRSRRSRAQLLASSPEGETVDDAALQPEFPAMEQEQRTHLEAPSPAKFASTSHKPSCSPSTSRQSEDAVTPLRSSHSTVESSTARRKHSDFASVAQ